MVRFHGQHHRHASVPSESWHHPTIPVEVAAPMSPVGETAIPGRGPIRVGNCSLNSLIRRALLRLSSLQSRSQSPVSSLSANGEATNRDEAQRIQHRSSLAKSKALLLAHAGSLQIGFQASLPRTETNH